MRLKSVARMALVNTSGQSNIGDAKLLSEKRHAVAGH